MSPNEPPFRAIAESTYDWETWIDETGVVRWVNRAALRFTGYTPDECLALPDFPFTLVHPDDRERMRTLMRGALAGSTGNDVEFRLLRRDDSVLWVAMSWQPLAQEGGVPRGLRTSVRDIHDRKLAEEKLRLAERDAARLAHERTEFLASLSHELRSPLHCIAGFAELLERAPDDASRERWLRILREQSEATRRLVEDLLHFVAGERRELAPKLDPIDLGAIAASEVDAARPRAHPGVELRFTRSVDAAARALGDADHVRRVVANLLGNALRFTERGSVDVTVDAHERGLRVVVRDTGVGMTRDLAARVRAPFVQGAPSSASRGGVGLGLAIVDRLLHAMGGTLELESTPGIGTTATATFPRAAEPPQALALAAPESTTEGIDPTLAVLVIDDSAAARELVVAMLAALGITADEANGVTEALARRRHGSPDLVLVDYHMPEVDGVRVIETLHREGALSREAIAVLLTANVFVARPDEPLPKGIDRVLEKPLRVAQLRRVLREASDRKLVRECLDLDVIRELEGIVDAEGRSLRARQGPAMLRALGEAIDAVEHAEVDESRRRAAHALVGLALAAGSREVAAQARSIEGGAGDVALVRHAMRRFVTAWSARP